MGNFIRRFQSAVQDHVLNRQEIQDLRAAHKALQKEAPSEYDTRLGGQILQTLDTYTETTRLNYTIPIGAHQVMYDFKLTPHYSESELLPGVTLSEKLSHLAQSDALNQTHSDSHRCAAASLISAYLLTGGSLSSLGHKLGVSQTPQMSYEFLHLAQDALYNLGNTNGSNGLSQSVSYRYRGDTLTSTTASGEVANAAQALGMKVEALLGTTRSGLYQRKETVDAFFQKNPRGALVVGTYMDINSGDLSAPSEAQPVNHAVLVFKEFGKIYLLNSGLGNNGLGDKRIALTPSQFKDLVYNTSGSVFGLSQ